MQEKSLGGIGLKNFRLFKNYQEFSFKDITVLTGPNNSGKSSLIKALLLLNNSQAKWDKSNLWGERLDFYSGSHGLSGIKNTLNNEKDGMILSVRNGKYSFCYEFDNNGELVYNYKICKNGQLIIQQAGGYLQVCFSRLIEYLEYLLSLDKKFKITIESLIGSLKYYIGDNSDFISIYFEETSELGLLPKISYNPKSIQEKIISKYFDDYHGELTDFGIDAADLEQELTVKWLFSEIIKTDDIESEVITYLFPPIEASNEFLPEIFYLPSSKGSIKRSYSLEDNDFFKNIVKSKVESQRDLFSLSDKKFAAKWLDEFGIGTNLETNYNEITGVYSITIDDRSIADYGLGTAQIVFLLIWISNIRNDFQRNSKFKPLIILEEPESNLHPALQSKLMEFIVELSQTLPFQFLIETHSEYLIRKLQYLTAKKKLKPEDTIIYYFNDPNKIPKGEKQLREIKIREDGSLTDDFGPGFFDEADNIALELYRLQRNNSINN